MEEIFGYIDSIVFANEENGFTIARIKEPKSSELTCILGTLPSIQPGENIRCIGEWKFHPKHGKQFEVNSFELKPPTDLVGIQKYLECGMIKGIGPVYAERIVKEFGTDTLRIIDEVPERLLEVPGIGIKKIEHIKKCWDEQRSIRNVMIFLRGHGVSPGFAQKIFKTYAERSVEKVQANPYALAKEIHGVGFKSADKIAEGLGIPKDSPTRIDAGLEYILWKLSEEGHVCYPRSSLLQTAESILTLTQEVIAPRIDATVQSGLFVQEQELIWIKPLYASEVGIAKELLRIKNHPSLLRYFDNEKALQWVEEKLQIQFAAAQKEAVLKGISEKMLIITGGPGTGKSTITRAILEISEKLTKRILLAAPTGRAAKRLSKITRKKAHTIHSLLEMDFTLGEFKKNRENPLICDMIIIDEASMIDTFLMYQLLKAIPSHAKLIFIGDIDQLPSVGPGNVLKDMIKSERIPICTLKEIFRQAKDSQIILNAHRVNQGEFPDLRYAQQSDFLYYPQESPEEITAQILELITTTLPRKYHFHRFEDIQVLSPMKKGQIGTENLNQVLQEALNPSPNALIKMGKRFLMGDKVMQIRNNYQKLVFNGDVGYITQIDHVEQIIRVTFEGKAVDYDFNELDELILAYAVSIHKYQGSECPCIIIPMHISHFKLLYRNLLYTGITRGKKLVILVGTKKAIAIAVKNEEVKQRYTGLDQRIKEWISEEILAH